MTALRLFVAVDPAPEVRDALGAEIAELRRTAPRAKWVDVSVLHLTLAFLGVVGAERVPEISAAIAGATRGLAPFDVVFRGAGAFRGKRPRVLWAGVAGDVPALEALQHEVAAALAPLGFPPEERPFTAHLTLARSRDGEGDDGLASCASALADRAWGRTRIAAVTLYRSDLAPKGPTYTPLATCPLGG